METRNRSRRDILGSLALMAISPLVAAQSGLPSGSNKPVRLVVPLPPGGPSDSVARAVAQALAQTLGQPVVVENRPGGAGAIAAQAVLAASDDSLTLLYVIGSMIATPLMQTRPPWDWSTDFVPVAQIGRFDFAVFVHPGVPARTLADLVAHARSNPRALNFASSTPSELLAATQFMEATGTEMTQVPYKGSTQALPDLVAGRVQVTFTPVSAGLSFARDGRLRMLATIASTRNALAPDVPTLVEAGVSGVSVPTWQAIFASAKASANALVGVTHSLERVLDHADLRSRLVELALRVDYAGPQALSRAVAKETGQWAALIRRYGLGGQ